MQEQQLVGGITPTAGGAAAQQQEGAPVPQQQQRVAGAHPAVPLDVGSNSRPPIALRPLGAVTTETPSTASVGASQLSQMQPQGPPQQQQGPPQHQQQGPPQQLPQPSLTPPSSTQQQMSSPAPDTRLTQPSLQPPLAPPSAGRCGTVGSGGQSPSPRTQQQQQQQQQQHQLQQQHHQLQQQQHIQQQETDLSRASGSCRTGPGPGIAGGGAPSPRFMRPPPSPAATCGGGPSSGGGGMPLVAVSSAPQAVLMPRPPPPPPPPPPVLCSRPPPSFPHPPSLMHHHHLPHHHHHGPPPPPPHHLQQRLMDPQLPPLPPFYDDDDDFGAVQRGGRRPHGTLRITKWVNPIPFDPDDGQQQVGEQELATKMLQIQSKRFYIDVKQNRRGRFMKVAEIGADGRRNQVFLALSTAAEFREHLTQFSDFYSNLGPPNPDTLPEDGKLKSETMVKDNRRYYLDLKENSRGRFLRVSQTIARGGPRCQIAIPAQGMIEFRDALQELLDEFGTDDGGFKGELPEGRHMRVENKNFYFDIGQNNRGIYMRISEVKTNFRTAITIPEKSWSRFRDIFSDYVDKMKEGGDKEKAPPSGESSSSSPNK